METRAHHVLIGLFTVIVVAAALLFGLWLAKSSTDRQFAEYQPSLRLSMRTSVPVCGASTKYPYPM